MRRALVYVSRQRAGILEELTPGEEYKFVYDKSYSGPPVSLTMPTCQKEHSFDRMPPFFEGALPEGLQLEALLKQKKLDNKDLFGQLVAVGKDLVGAVTVRELLTEDE